jgi:uncharacterized protein (TIGR03435 family)
MSGGPGSSDPGRIADSNVLLGSLVGVAYDIPFYRLVAPSWFNAERYDITAIVPAGATKEQFRQMLQRLLAERFKLQAHPENRELPVYELMVAKGGPKFRPWSADDEQKLVEAKGNSESRKVVPDANGYPILPSGMSFSVINNGHARIRGERELMSNFAESLSGMADRPVIDATGLKGEYAFTLSWIMKIPGAPTTSDQDPGPDLFTALSDQLGLRLEAKRAPMPMVVIDHAEKVPTEN